MRAQPPGSHGDDVTQGLEKVKGHWREAALTDVLHVEETSCVLPLSIHVVLATPQVNVKIPRAAVPQVNVKIPRAAVPQLNVKIPLAAVPQINVKIPLAAVPQVNVKIPRAAVPQVNVKIPRAAVEGNIQRCRCDCSSSSIG